MKTLPKMKMKHWIRALGISSFALVLGGCSQGLIKPEQGSPSVAQVYKAGNSGNEIFYNDEDKSQHLKPSKDVQSIRLPSLQDNNAQQPVHQDTVSSTLNSQFPKLSNPSSIMYIFGHYAGDGQLPVPGHFTTFTLFTRDYYALPDEVAMPYSDGQFI